MTIHGDIKTANKFYIINSSGSIEWVPSLITAKKYVTNPLYTEWFEKDIYATNEELVINSEGLTVLRSQYEEEQVKKSIKDIEEIFKQQAEEYLKERLLEYSTNKGYESFYTLISWKDSSIKQYKDEAKAALKYRDTVYTYMFNFINVELEKFLNENLDNHMEVLYSKYISAFPEV